MLFSFGFAYFGRRGHDEASTVNSVAVARLLPGGVLDVTSWSNVFVINGADYEIVLGGTGRLYATAQTFEPVNGVIQNGGRGRFRVDIPPYSSQPFVHRMKLKGDDRDVKVQEFVAHQKLTRLTLIVGKDFPSPASGDVVSVLYRDQIYSMNWTARRLDLAASPPQPLSEFMALVQWNDLSPYMVRRGNVPVTNAETVPGAQLDKMRGPLMAWSLDLRRHSEIPAYRLPDDRVRLFVWAELPESLKVESARIGRQQGRVLYVVDLPKPVKP